MNKRMLPTAAANLSLSRKQRLIQLLSDYITPARMQKMQGVLRNRTRHLCVVLEDIYQSHNASAVLRSCDCFGVQDVYIIENKNKYQINPDVALGATNWLNLSRHRSGEHNTRSCLQALKKNGYRLMATTPHQQDVLLEELPVQQKTALLFGTELGGLSDVALSMADGYVKIPMVGFTESFNISVSAAICLYHLTGKVRSTVTDWGLNENEKADVLLQWILHSVRNPEALTHHLLQTMEAE